MDAERLYACRIDARGRHPDLQFPVRYEQRNSPFPYRTSASVFLLSSPFFLRLLSSETLLSSFSPSSCSLCSLCACVCVCGLSLTGWHLVVSYPQDFGYRELTPAELEQVTVD